jgi:hypothetical protein
MVHEIRRNGLSFNSISLTIYRKMFRLLELWPRERRACAICEHPYLPRY